MGKNGFVKVDPQERLSITNNGEVLQKNEIQGEMKITDFKKPYRLVREGDNNFKPLYPDNPGIESQGYVIKQGYLEGSNVSSIQNMVQMISSYRNLEIDQRAIQAQEQTLDKAINSVGRVG
jgi:flagellar basal-body rod protein FlgG